MFRWIRICLVPSLERIHININLNYVTKHTSYKTSIKWDQLKDLMGFSTFFKPDSWDLNLADKWGQFIELNKAGPRGF